MSSALMLSASYLLTSLVSTTLSSIPISPDVLTTKNVQSNSLIAVHTIEQNTVAIKLQKYGGSPYGPDPRGGDPRDEQHDPNLPANKERDFNKAPDDVYGGKYPNGRAPY
ncbi:MAG: hypothetical protein QG625_2592 [Cyanobacteriota bacterium erpe_2018_sw_39hr_WHONDRS-SW48-000098_B_bin.30]|jgi:hypothetical protein|nr:hypothetical protein [Candidatus Obscuribacter sp.]MBK7841492.1 hypothetical protein [Candidatus Obscuribacter sp.]MBK9622840.1 hypothetical protein [Candidatus Obscuribacter sp.]MDQ5966437.1 hypothetical protein [Cyanobacteriota bacterium erpe_2018_sw_39hr_WHONDRS-SW48-000098_B_bin.30]